MRLALMSLNGIDHSHSTNSQIGSNRLSCVTTNSSNHWSAKAPNSLRHCFSGFLLDVSVKWYCTRRLVVLMTKEKGWQKRSKNNVVCYMGGICTRHKARSDWPFLGRILPQCPRALGVIGNALLKKRGQEIIQNQQVFFIKIATAAKKKTDEIKKIMNICTLRANLFPLLRVRISRRKRIDVCSTHGSDWLLAIGILETLMKFILSRNHNRKI